MLRGIQIHQGFIRRYYEDREHLMNLLEKSGALDIVRSSKIPKDDESFDMYFLVEVKDDATASLIDGMDECDEWSVDNQMTEAPEIATAFLMEHKSIRYGQDLQQLMNILGVSNYDTLAMALQDADLSKIKFVPAL